MSQVKIFFARVSTHLCLKHRFRKQKHRDKFEAECGFYSINHNLLIVMSNDAIFDS